MAKENLAQHEQRLKLLEKSIRQICDEYKMLSNLTHDAWTRTMELFVLTDALRGTRLEFEKEHSPKDNAL